jgi:formylglycine-generating enzyme required for sulfatase activity
MTISGLVIALRGRRPVALASIVSLCVVGCGCTTSTPAPARRNTWTEPATGMRFARIDPGEFVMGSPPSEPGREVQERQHLVVLTRPFWLGIFEVTQHEWEAVMGTNPSHFQDGDNHRPVEQVTWFETHDFLTRLAQRSPGNHFRLPTEAEWEYACRAGTTTAYGTGPTLTHAQANFAESAERAAAGEGATMPVGSFPPNAWGLYDMAGNVWEWTEDEHCPYADGQTVDPVLGCSEPLKVIRGGSWYFGADSARCGLRYTHRPQDLGFSLGFRVVREDSAP